MNDYHIMKRILLIAILTAKLMFQADNLSAKLVIPQIFSDNMVLQCNAKASIWGWADPNSTITLKTI